MTSPVTLTPSTTFSAFLPPLTLADDLRPKTACSLIFWIASMFLLHKSQTTCRLAFAKYSHWSVLNRFETGHGWGLWRIPRKAGAEGARYEPRAIFAWWHHTETLRQKDRVFYSVYTNSFFCILQMLYLFPGGAQDPSLRTELVNQKKKGLSWTQLMKYSVS